MRGAAAFCCFYILHLIQGQYKLETVIREQMSQERRIIKTYPLANGYYPNCIQPKSISLMATGSKLSDDLL